MALSPFAFDASAEPDRSFGERLDRFIIKDGHNLRLQGLAAGHAGQSGNARRPLAGLLA